MIYAPCEPQPRRQRRGGPCVLYFTLAVDHRLAGRPHCPRGLRPLQQPPASLLRPPRGSIGSADCTVASSFLPSIFRVLLLLLAALCKSSAMLVRFVWPLFCPRSTQSGRPASCLSLACTHTLLLLHSLSHRRRVEKKNCSLLLSSSRALPLPLPSLSLPAAHSLLSGNSSGEI